MIAIQITSILIIFLGTVLVFKALGARNQTLLYTKEERDEWERRTGPVLLPWLTKTNIIGTLTSLATVWLFFIGNSKLFGPWIFVCCFAVLLSAIVTNYFTLRITNGSYVKRLMGQASQNGGVIASIFHRKTKGGRQTASAVRLISLLSISSIIGLEFSVFADISGKLLGINSLPVRAALLFAISFCVLYFTIRYGLRGFIFADLFHAPILAFCACVLFCGCVIYWMQMKTPMNFAVFFEPILPFRQCSFFALHVIFLSSFYVLLSEGHWIRLWVFRENETRQQLGSQMYVSVIWAILCLVGLFASYVTGPGAFGETAVVGLLTQLSHTSPLFLAAFWCGGAAALFSTADAQIYSFMLVKRFNCHAGELTHIETSSLVPLRSAVLASGFFAAMYCLIKSTNIPFEKIVFLIIPIPMVLLPAFFLSAFERCAQPVYIWMSSALYLGASIAGVLKPESELMWTLMAAILPVAVAVAALLFSIPEQGGEALEDL